MTTRVVMTVLAANYTAKIEHQDKQPDGTWAVSQAYKIDKSSAQVIDTYVTDTRRLVVEEDN